MKFQILSILFIIATILINFKFVESQYSSTTYYYVQNSGIDGTGCGYSNNPCYSVFGALSAYYKVSNGNYYQMSPLVIYMGPSTTISMQYGAQPFTLNGFNVTIIGSPDGSTYMSSSNGYASMFNTTYGYYQSSVSITFTNITYGSSTGYCSSNGYSTNSPASLFTIAPTANLNSIVVNFNNFTYNCVTSYFNLIQVTAGSSYNYMNDASADWNGIYFSAPAGSLSPNVIINLNNFTVPSTHFVVELFNSSYNPIVMNIANSQFGNSNQTGISMDSSIFLVGRGFINVKSSTFNVTYSHLEYSTASYVFDIENVEFNNKDTNVTIISGSNQYLTCSGCFYTGYNVNISTVQSASATLVISNGAASFYNSYLYSQGSTSELISASSSQLSIRTSILVSTTHTAIEMDGVDLSMFYNQYSGYNGYTFMYNYQTSKYPVIHCSSSSLSSVLMNEGDKGYGFDCDQYQSNQKVKWAFVYMAVGIGGVISMFVFLFVSIAIIKRCGGE